MQQYKLPRNPIFIDEEISVSYATPPIHTKTPSCPDTFEWNGEKFEVDLLLSEWKDFSRRGRMGRNMRPAHLQRALVTGSLGSGRFFFRVRTRSGRIFDLYYDREIKNAVDKAGRWVLFREYKQDE
ncbi:MAG: hypothetical protein FJZ98_06905 [Chloroflexi bacterium]|nr:hypothetical protein [Chloroflexota bacterium]